jgi:hypothetical protein
MSKVVLAFGNRADEATLTGGTWVAGMPIDNLKDRVLSHTARSTNVVETSTKFDIALPKFRDVQCIALCRHNLQLDAKFRIRAFYDSGMTQCTYDSDWQFVWRRMYNTKDLPWRNSNFWAGKILAEDLEGFFWNLVHWMPTQISSRYWRIELSDTGNTFGYLEIGRLFMATGWMPTYNMEYGASLQYEARTEIEEAWDGTEYFAEKPPYRIARFNLGHLSEAEAMAQVFDMQRVSGISKEVLFSWSLDDVDRGVRRSFLGRMRSLSPIEQPYYDAHKAQFEIKELL